MCARQRGGLDCNGKIDPKTPLPGIWLRPAAALLVLICLACPVWAQSGQPSEYRSSDTPQDIPDQGAITSSITVSDGGPIGDLNVKLNITHGWNSDLDIFLIAPDGTRVELFTDVGGSSSNFRNTILDNEASESITEGSAPFTGSFRPEGSLAALIEKDVSGTWTLEISDDKTEDVGRLESWCLIVTIGSIKPLPAPVIRCQASMPGGTRDEVSWNDVGRTTRYESTLPEETFYDGTLSRTIAVKNSGAIEDLNVKVNISHQQGSELDVYLVASDGTRIELFTDIGSSQGRFIDTELDDQASASITAGAAPFTGRYRPEGSLGSLIGKDIHGEWTLEITDGSWKTSETLNSWTLIADVADVLYYVECATHGGFVTVVANSGWTTNRSHVFGGLDPKKQYWYRAKAKPLTMWSQTSMTDFQGDALTDTIATRVGDAVLASVDDLGPKVNVIPNPSFEISNGGWGGVISEPDIFVGRVRYLWASQGEWAGCVEFRPTCLSGVGSYAYQHAPVDWTGVATLIFDYASYFNASDLKVSVLIGDKQIWSADVIGNALQPHYNEKVDVSGFTGNQDLRLRAESKVLGYIHAGIVWDNLRTYGSLGYVTAGSIVSTPIRLGDKDTWDILEFDATTPAGTQLTVDILPETGTTPIAGYANVLTGTVLSGINARTIRLCANLSTSNPGVTPELHFWSVGYSEAARESEWSNVASSLP
jgi:subtilisin-like proprotein convertase family protein